MSICRQCGQDRGTATTCTIEKWHHGAAPIPYGQERGGFAEHSDRCHDCGVEKGGVHHLYCDVEQCPRCHDQALYCACSVQAKGGRSRGLLHPALGVYFLADVMRLTGAKRSQVENWTRSGWLKPEGPSMADVMGTGHHRTFSFANLVDAALGARLSQFRIPIASLFKGEGVKRLRDLIPDLSAIVGKSDRQLAAMYAKDLSAEDWREVLATGRSRADYLAERVATWRTMGDLWGAFLNPKERPAGSQFLLQVSLDAGKYRATWSSERGASLPDVAVVVNLGTLFADLEDATGDHWGAA